MPSYGGLSPYPKRYGGGTPRLKTILDSLNRACGDGMSTEWSSIVYAENIVIAKMIDAGWATNERLGGIRDPRRMTDPILGRWEVILKLQVPPGDPAASRRRRVLEKFEAVGNYPDIALITALSQRAIGTSFVAVEHIDYSLANIHVPDGSYPWGTVADGAPWSSTVAHVLIRTQKVAAQTEAQFYDAMGALTKALDPALPAWASFDWYRPGASSYAVTGGPSAGGFYLDSLANLDNQVFGK